LCCKVFVAHSTPQADFAASDTIYIPAGWIHGVTPHSDSLTIIHNWVGASTFKAVYDAGNWLDTTERQAGISVGLGQYPNLGKLCLCYLSQQLEDIQSKAAQHPGRADAPSQQLLEIARSAKAYGFAKKAADFRIANSVGKSAYWHINATL
jgi:hypothetical protein